MNTRDLEYLIALATHRHFGKAAEVCFVSQPALSMQIKKLEETLGVKLLERTNKSVMLTEVGLRIVEQARFTLQQVDALHAIAKAAKDPYKGELKIGIIPTLAPYLLPMIIPSLAKTFSGISFYLIEEKTALLVEKLKAGKLDAAILATPMADKHIKATILFEEEYLLAVPHSHPLAKQKTMKPQDLQDQNLLLLEEGHCMREQTLALCQRMSASEARGFQATSLETLRHMVAAGVGMTLMPALAEKPHDGITYISFSNPKPRREIAIFWREQTARQQVLTDIAKAIKKMVSRK